MNNIIAECRKSDRGLLIGECIIVGLFLIPALLGFLGWIFYVPKDRWDSSQIAFLAMGIALAVLDIFTFIGFQIERYGCQFEWLELTDTLLIGHKGIINKRTETTPISKIQSIASTRSGITGLYTIKICSAAIGGEYVYTDMIEADDFVQAVQNMIQLYG